jgi:hypothetical protein
MILFYLGENLVNTEQYQTKIQKIENPVEQSPVKSIAMDLQSADSLTTPADSAAIAAEEVVAEPEMPQAAEVVSFSFMEKLVYNKADIAIIWGYILFLIAALATVIFPLFYTIANPANMLRSLLVLVGVAALIGISYFLSSGETINIVGYSGTDNSNPAALKLIDTGLIFMYFTLGLALFSILYAEIAKYFK